MAARLIARESKLKRALLSAINSPEISSNCHLQKLNLVPSIAINIRTKTTDASISSNSSKHDSGSSSTQQKKSESVSESRQRQTNLRWFFDTAIDKATEQPLVKLNPVTMMYSNVRSDDNTHLIRSAVYLRREMPIRIAHIIKEMRSLPFIVGCNQLILEIHERWIKAFRNFEEFDPEIRDLQTEMRFTKTISETLSLNKDILAMLAEGFRDTRRYIKSEECVRVHLNKILSGRLACRLLCEHHLALHKQSNAGVFKAANLNEPSAFGANGNEDESYYLPSSASSSSSSNSSGYDKLSAQSVAADSEWVGIINKKFSPKRAVEIAGKLVTNVCKQKYGIAPKIRIDGHIQASFVYMPLPVQYILPELLKNAFRATVEHNMATANGQLPDVCVTISLNEKDCIIRIRDRGGGIPHGIVNNVFDYHFTTSAQRNSSHQSDDTFDANKNVGLGLLCEQSQSQSVMYGYGFGLPTSKVYAEYLGGSLSFQSMQGIGTDFYLRLALLDSESSTVRI